MYHDLDGTLIAKGLILGLTALDNLPTDKQVLRERDDIVRILRYLIPDVHDLDMIRMDVEIMTGESPDLDLYD